MTPPGLPPAARGNERRSPHAGPPAGRFPGTPECWKQVRTITEHTVGYYPAAASESGKNASPGAARAGRAGTGIADVCLPGPAGTPRLPDKPSLSLTRLRRLAEWMLLNARRRPEVKVAELAEAAGVSVRRLQAICRQVQNVTPTQMFEDVALIGVYAALHGCPRLPSPRTVEEAAAMAGYRRPGQFRASYEEAFGTNPFPDEEEG